MRAAAGFPWLLVMAACSAVNPRVTFIEDAEPAFGHAVRRASEVVVLEKPPSEPHRRVGRIAWRQAIGEDAAALAAIREEAGRHGCGAVVLPAGRGEWAECVVLDNAACQR